MYDTVGFWLDAEKLNGDPFETNRFLSNSVDCLSSIKGHYINGSIKNIRVSINERGVRLIGSLPKFVKDSNTTNLSRAEVRNAIEQLSDSLHLPIEKGKVTRLDIGSVMEMEQPPAAYYSCLGEKSRYKRLQATANTLYYNQAKCKLIFYDKVLEQKQNRIEKRDSSFNGNQLRYELRFLSAVNTQLKEEVVTGEMLYDEKFYFKMLKLWGDHYQGIEKRKSQALSHSDLKTIKTPTHGLNLLLSSLLNEADNDYVQNYISILKAHKIYSDPKNYSRLKQDIRNRTRVISVDERFDLMNELDEKIKFVLENHYEK